MGRVADRFFLFFRECVFGLTHAVSVALPLTTVKSRSMIQVMS
jgi:hypothetical protein